MNLPWNPDSSFEVGLVRISLLMQYQRPQRQKRSPRDKIGELWTLNNVLAGGPGSPCRRATTNHSPWGWGWDPSWVWTPCNHGRVLWRSLQCNKGQQYWESRPPEEQSEPTGRYPAHPTLSLSNLHTEKLLPDLGWPVSLTTDGLPTADSAAARLARSFLGQRWQKLQMKKIKPLHGGPSEPSGFPDCGH